MLLCHQYFRCRLNLRATWSWEALQTLQGTR